MTFLSILINFMQDVLLDVIECWLQCAAVMARPTVMNVCFAATTALISLILKWFTKGHVILRVILILLDD